MAVDVAAAGSRRRAEIGLIVAAAVVMALLGPYETYRLPAALRFGYWIACMVGGGMIGVAVDALVLRAVADLWRRLPATVLGMTLPVTIWVYAVGRLAGVQPPPTASGLIVLLWQVFAISLPVMAVRALVWRTPPTLIETRTIVEAPLPEAEAAFRRRLSAKRRTARLIAVEADDHYLRVHTDTGAELLTMRFGDALAELARAHGYQIHRSWWVAADAIERVSWRRGGGEARLIGAIVAPVSRNHAATLREAGWT